MFYQFTFLISPELNQEQREILLKKIETLINEKEGTLDIESPQKIKLAYAIQKKKEAFLANLKLNILEDKIEEVKKEIEKEKDILRYLLIKERKEKKELKKEKKEVKRSRMGKPKPKKLIKEKKVELEKIEEKLKELI